VSPGGVGRSRGLAVTRDGEPRSADEADEGRASPHDSLRRSLRVVSDGRSVHCGSDGTAATGAARQNRDGEAAPGWIPNVASQSPAGARAPRDAIAVIKAQVTETVTAS
jgi:hypothetical protein